VLLLERSLHETDPSFDPAMVTVNDDVNKSIVDRSASIDRRRRRRLLMDGWMGVFFWKKLLSKPFVSFVDRTTRRMTFFLFCF
jgi:hypothetical protein